ncbi:MAG: arginine--tRNA ligase [Rhodospirillaceae bacterium]|nr:arginine--tRNA ligase [Rhodospirillaceae bacterium]
MNYFNYIRNNITEILNNLKKTGYLPVSVDIANFSVESARDRNHWDIATNVALALSKSANLKPRELAQEIVACLKINDEIESVEIAGPGFINIIFKDNFWQTRLVEVLKNGNEYGSIKKDLNKLINIEYVSANPTGPMHVGHGRGAVVGDVLANLLGKAGYRVTKEYYINDAGTQIDILTKSLFFRYQEALGLDVGNMPDDYYPGDYLAELARNLAEKDGDKWVQIIKEEGYAGLKQVSIEAMMEIIRSDLFSLGIVHDVFVSERDIVNNNEVTEALETLKQKGLIYQGVLEPPKGRRPDDWEPRPQTLFKATQFGDDVDRPVKKSDGSWTYFATDMAYHRDKFKRGFKDMINIWGADHSGYVKRMKSAVVALTDGLGQLDVKLCQMVNLMDNGKPLKMSKRSGTFVTLRDVIDEVGKDVVRFMMLTRKNDAQLDFDLVKVKEQSRDNPVFYVQYSHARCCSVLRNALDIFNKSEIDDNDLIKADISLLTDSSEINLIKIIASWPQVVLGAAESREPHRIAYYLYELSSAFHSLWSKGSKERVTLRFLVPKNRTLTLARLAMVRSLAITIASGLEVMGVEPLEEME